MLSARLLERLGTLDDIATRTPLAVATFALTLLSLPHPKTPGIGAHREDREDREDGNNGQAHEEDAHEGNDMRRSGSEGQAARHLTFVDASLLALSHCGSGMMLSSVSNILPRAHDKATYRNYMVLT
ncbi:hypothetical protein BU23DRAFT_195265 [Bimuria novae-zelandiae CBS 107.79]|uniref:Uncharacterized protein n=1 Tax=Bimuria novae-zelandiae CBS 107.79 TaxID=1447943 RepID=A0A6A5V1P9_9PLEO|nr:hypothetical protein BU23DRAFT_195265 [Bimuria novae-zelandiae CBS 107.79]